MALPIPHAVQGPLWRLPTGSITDIGGSELASALRSMLATHLFFPPTEHHQQEQPDAARYRLLPTALLSDDEGLRLWRTVTRLPDYYQTRDEMALLQAHGAAIASHIQPGSVLLDLGCGDARKVVPLLHALDRRAVPCLYLALDLSRPALERNLLFLAGLKLRHVRHAALWGTFDDMLGWASRTPWGPPRLFLSLGSMLGNDHFGHAVQALARWREALRTGPTPDRILLGIDAMPSADHVWRSYHDEQGLVERLVRNGMSHVNTLLGWPWYRKRDWVVEAVLERDGNQGVFHSFAIRALRDIAGSDDNVFVDVDQAASSSSADASDSARVSGAEPEQPLHVPRIERGTVIRCYEAFKYGHGVMESQFVAAQLREVARWESPPRRHGVSSVVTAMHEYLLEAGADGADDGHADLVAVDVVDKGLESDGTQDKVAA